VSPAAGGGAAGVLEATGQEPDEVTGPTTRCRIRPCLDQVRVRAGMIVNLQGCDFGCSSPSSNPVHLGTRTGSELRRERA